MAHVAVVHPDLRVRGGAEDVCMHVLDALQDEHDLTLLTLADPDFDALNEYFETRVRRPDVRLAGRVGPALNRLAGDRAMRLQAALLGGGVRRREREFDLIVSTKNEFAFRTPSVQYVHNPQFAGAVDPGLDVENPLRWAYNRLCAEVAGLDGSAFDAATLLANSDWTAEVTRDAHGVDVRTVYPPVDVAAFSGRPWDEREDGFLTVGRVDASKRVLANVEVIAALRERGHDVHLHVVGPTTDADYCERVERRAAELPFVSVEGAVSRDRLIEMIGRHRYGLHGRPYEHFGIAVAEMAAGGAVPFAPASGGQREVLDADGRLLYESPADAVETIDRLLSDADAREEVRARLGERVPAFGRDRFRDEIRAIVAEAAA